ncbi:hypothetical protein HBB16_15125 [Pseudonocardia sp. MCCB 268]|nr:hypothetical protein [Pseudonocardia cytotoxica]
MIAFRSGSDDPPRLAGRPAHTPGRSGEAGAALATRRGAGNPGSPDRWEEQRWTSGNKGPPGVVRSIRTHWPGRRIGSRNSPARWCRRRGGPGRGTDAGFVSGPAARRSTPTRSPGSGPGRGGRWRSGTGQAAATAWRTADDDAAASMAASPVDR